MSSSDNTLALNINTLKDFIGKAQLSVMKRLTRGEEGEYFLAKFTEMANTVKAMPKTYETEGVDMDDKICVLHYFYANMDWYIIEKDMEADEPQYQAFGLANIGFGLSGGGYISIDEIITTTPAEIDLYWIPKTVREVKRIHN